VFALARWYRAARYGPPIVVVSGLPRSGTSMMMRMLAAGGLPVVSDGVKSADAANPHGYFEDERVKDLDKGGDTSWLAGMRGKAVKVISFLLRDLPDTNNYEVIFLRREMGDVLASQEAMLKTRGAPAGGADARRMAAGFEAHLADVRQLLARRACFRVLYVDYDAVVNRPLEQAQLIQRFMSRPLDTGAMAGVVDPALHRHRGNSAPQPSLYT
jgi:hypothetical protein